MADRHFHETRGKGQRAYSRIVNRIRLERLGEGFLIDPTAVSDRSESGVKLLEKLTPEGLETHPSHLALVIRCRTKWLFVALQCGAVERILRPGERAGSWFAVQRST